MVGAMAPKRREDPRDWFEPTMQPYLPILGAVAVDAARIEWGLVGIRALLQPGRGFSEGFTIAHDRLVRGIRGDLRTLDPTMSAIWAPTILHWVTVASSLLRTRGELMHSAWIVGTDSSTGQLTVYVRNHRVAEAKRQSVPEFQALAERLHTHMDAYPAIWTACTMLVGASPEGLSGDAATPSGARTTGGRGQTSGGDSRGRSPQKWVEPGRQ